MTSTVRGASRLGRLTRGHRLTAALAVVAALLAAVPTVISPLLIGAAVSAIEDADHSALAMVASALAGLGLLGAAALAARTLFSQRLAIDLEAELRERYVERLLELDLDELERRSTGDLVSRATVDLRQFRTILGSTAPAAVQAIATIVAAALVMLVKDLPLALATLAPLTVMVALGARYARSLRAADYTTREALGAVATQAEEDVAGVAVIKGFAREADRLSRFRVATQRALDSAVRSARLQARFGSAISLLSGLGMLIALLYGGLLAARRDGGISDAEFVAFYVYVVALVGPGQQVGWILGTAQTAYASVARVLEVVGADDPDVSAGAVPLPDGPGALALRGVSASYDGGEPVLRDIDLDVAPGSTLGVTGRTGSGKTTLLEVVDRLRPHDSGAVKLGGVPLALVQEGALRARVAMVADPDFLFTTSIGDNIAYGRPAASLEEIRRAARSAAADGFIEALPDGYATVVGERALTLSGGERQRIALARALLLQPGVLLLDNATGSLDQATERAVLDGLARGAPARATISVSYRPAPLASADQVVMLDRGAVAPGGDVATMLAPRPEERELLRGAAPARAQAGGADGDPSDGDPGDGDPGDRASPPGEARAEEPAAAAAGPATPVRSTGPHARPPSRWVRLSRLRELVAGERRRIILGALATVVALSLTILPPYLGARAVDDVVRPNDTSGLVGICAILAAVLVVGALAVASEIVLLIATGQAVLARLRVRVLEHVLALPMAFFDRVSSGAVVSRLTNDIEALDQLLIGGLSVLISSVAALVVTCVVLLLLDPELALATCAVLPLTLIATVAFSSRLDAAYRGVTHALSSLTAYLTETVGGMRTVRSYAQGARHAEHFARLNRATRDRLDSTIGLQAGYLAFVELLTGLALAGVVLLGGTEAIDGTITVGIVVAFTTYLRTAIAPIPSLVGLYGIYAQGMAGLDHVHDLLAEPVRREEPRRQGPNEAGLAVRGVWFSYAGAEWILRDVSLDVPTGATVALVGPTGAGKSTLVKLLLGFYDPGRGSIALGGRDLRTLTPQELRAGVGYVAQEPFLFSGTVWENIAFASPTPSREDASRAASELGVLDALERLPAGIDTQVGVRGEALSAGQRQLVALARATLGDRPIVVLDEPTSSVDTATERTIQNALARLRAGRTTVVVAHRLSTVRDADRIHVVDAGRIVESGTHRELLARKGRYARLYGVGADDR